MSVHFSVRSTSTQVGIGRNFSNPSPGTTPPPPRFLAKERGKVSFEKNRGSTALHQRRAAVQICLPKTKLGRGVLTRQGSVRVLPSSQVQGEVPDMGQGAERRGSKRRWIQGSCPHTRTKGPSCRKKPRTRLPRALNPTAGQLPHATERGQMARHPKMAQNTNISEEWLLTQSRADCESWNVPRRRTVLERDSRTSQVQGIMPR